jgi:hypothetical protein
VEELRHGSREAVSLEICLVERAAILKGLGIFNMQKM